MTTMQIGELAERTGMSLRSLRHYDEIGLLVPSARTDGGFRLYTDADLERLLLIRRMKPLGYSLDEMRSLLAVADAPTDDAASRARLAEFVVDAEGRRARLERDLAWADEFLELLRDR
jgi:MerR family copper efflux transcriptional regulator